MSGCIRVEFLLPVLLCCGFVTAWSRGDDGKRDVEAPKSSPIDNALTHAVGANLDYCQQWLDSNDFKSLDETAAGVQILVQILTTRGEEANWQARCRELAGGVEALRTAARQQKGEAAKREIQSLRETAAALAKTLPGKPRKMRVRPAGGLRPLMKLLDGTYADAKAACTFDEPDVARQNALVLAELGALVSNVRSDARWRETTATMVQAAREAAADPSADAKTVRSRLSGVYQQCEACHNRSR